MEEEARKKRLRKNAPPRSSIILPDVPGSDRRDDEDSDESSSEGEDADPEKHKRSVRFDSQVSTPSVVNKPSVLDRLKVLLASSEEEGEEIDNDELLLNLQATKKGSQSLASITSQPASDRKLQQLLHLYCMVKTPM